MLSLFQQRQKGMKTLHCEHIPLSESSHLSFAMQKFSLYHFCWASLFRTRGACNAYIVKLHVMVAEKYARARVQSCALCCLLISVDQILLNYKLGLVFPRDYRRRVGS